jgi:hypothetical protein
MASLPPGGRGRGDARNGHPRLPDRRLLDQLPPEPDGRGRDSSVARGAAGNPRARGNDRARRPGDCPRLPRPRRLARLRRRPAQRPGDADRRARGGHGSPRSRRRRCRAPDPGRHRDRPAPTAAREGLGTGRPERPPGLRATAGVLEDRPRRDRVPGTRDPVRLARVPVDRAPHRVRGHRRDAAAGSDRRVCTRIDRGLRGAGGELRDPAPARRREHHRRDPAVAHDGRHVRRREPPRRARAAETVSSPVVAGRGSRAGTR